MSNGNELGSSTIVTVNISPVIPAAKCGSPPRDAVTSTNAGSSWLPDSGIARVLSTIVITVQNASRPPARPPRPRPVIGAIVRPPRPPVDGVHRRRPRPVIGATARHHPRHRVNGAAATVASTVTIADKSSTSDNLPV